MPSVAQGDMVQREVTLRELSQLVGGQVVGDPGVVVRNALPIQDADSTCITLADSDEQALRAEASAACAIVVSKPVVGCTKPLIVVDDVHSAFTKMILRLRPCSAIWPRLPAAEKCVSSNATVEFSAILGPGTFVSPGASIAASCTLGRGCFIHPNVTIMEGCRLGDECEIYPSSVLYPGTILGDRVLVHANATLGAFGFGYRQVKGCHQRTAQLGWVEIGSDVEIGAGTTIDRGTYGPTRVGDGTKIDNQVQIGHNCHIGKHNLLCSQVGIAGSCSTGDYVVMGGQVGMADHVHVGSRAMVAARSGLMYDVPEGEVVFGSPAGPRKDKLREVILIGKLPELKRELQELSKKVADLIQRHSTDNNRAA